MRVTLDAKGLNFLVDVPFHQNGLVQAAPNRKFMKSRRLWFLPGLRLNAKYLKSLGEDGRCELGEGVKSLIGHILDKTRIVDEPFPVGYSFKTKPREKQFEALNSAWLKPFYFFDMEMGTGKTKIYIDLASAMRQAGLVNALVVLTKNSVCPNVVREVDKHFPGEYTALAPEFGTIKGQREAKKFAESEGFKIVSAGLESLSVKQGSGKAFDYLWEFMLGNDCMLVVDEAHLIKNPKSNRARNVVELGGLSKFRYAGTGTPITNNLLDLFSMYNYLSPDIIGVGDYYSFKNRYTIRGGFENKEIIGYDNVDELMSLIKPWTFQATKADMEDLPPKIYMEPISVKMTREQRRVYDDLKKSKTSEFSGGELAVESVLQAYTLLHQICAGFVSFDEEDGTRTRRWIVEPKENPKFLELLNLLGEHPGVQFNIWTKHLMELHAVHDLIQRNIGSVVKLHGDMSRAEKEEAIARFTGRKATYMIATQETGGTGLTFTNCSNVVYLSNSFKYGDRVQSEDRNHRIGTKNAVTYTDIIMANSMDGRVLQVLKEKRSLADFVRQEMKDASKLE